MSRDRLPALLAGGSGRNGIDYVELVAGFEPPHLRVHFFTNVALDPATIVARIEGGDRIPEIPLEPVQAADLTADPQGRTLLALRTLLAGDFTTYLLTLDAPELDPAYRTAPIDFKAFCPSKFDCAPEPPDCPDDDLAVPTIDYLAKDFNSFVRLLRDDSAQRYESWVERSEADFGHMIAEVLSYVADELSYQQDRAAAEQTFETALSRRALAAHARLVDYELSPIRSARCELMLIVSGTEVTAGTRVDGTDAYGRQVAFELGEGLHGPATYQVDPAANWPIEAWWWGDGHDQCLPRGATQMWLKGDALGLVPGARVLLQTDLPDNFESIRQIVTLTDVATDFDPLFPPAGTKLTRISWGRSDALRRERDLRWTRVGGNILPATQGTRHEQRFAVAPVPAFASGAQRAFEREWTDQRSIARMPIDAAPLAWLPAAAAPEIILRQTDPEPRRWHHVTTLLDAEELEPAFTVDPEAWRVVMRDGDGTPRHWEPDGEDGATIRFGDNLFGAAPEPGSVFQVLYRTCGGAAGNLPADTVRIVVNPGVVTEARNPLPCQDGADAESAATLRRDAPQAFRAKPLRAVRTEDYRAAARELAWVQDAGARFRWTGSWHSGFVAADPVGGFEIDSRQHLELQRLIDRRRLAGVEVFTPRPRFVSIDLEITLCVAAVDRREAVEKRVLEALGQAGRNCRAGFFFADHFTFGTPLYRTRLEAAIMAVPGVKGVLAIRYRRRATLADYVDLPAVLQSGVNEILRVDNDPDWPERGTVTILTEGGQ